MPSNLVPPSLRVSVAPATARNAQDQVWQGHARQWHLVGAPLRPSPEDSLIMMDLLKDILSAPLPEARVAVLGVTPEVIQLDWPSHTLLHAFDHSLAMLETVWMPPAGIASQATLARWQDLPVPDSSYHAVVGDGSLNVLPRLDDYALLFAELARVSAPGGVTVLRCFLRPDCAETPQQVQDAVMAGRVGSFHALKWRLAMALAERRHGVIAVADIHQVFEALFERDYLVKCTGWTRDVVDTIDAYRAVDTVYTFPTQAQIAALCRPHWHIDAVQRGAYELAERCPTLRLVRQD